MNEKIVVHISFFQVRKYSQKHQKITNLRKIIENYLKISKNLDIYIHSNKATTLKNNKHIFKRIYNLKNQHSFYLTWKFRKEMEKQKNSYDFFIYTEDDILFTKKNFEYWKKYKDQCLSNKFNLGFMRVEDNKSKGLYLVDIFHSLYKYIFINDNKYFINDVNPYCAFWIYDKIEFQKFVNTKIWKFNWKKNYQAYGNIREMAAIGMHGINMPKYKKTIIPVNKSNNVDPGSIIRHLENKYSITYHGPGSLKLKNLIKLKTKHSNFIDKIITIFIKILKKFTNILSSN